MAAYAVLQSLLPCVGELPTDACAWSRQAKAAGVREAAPSV
jgi:hypothetical protein